MGINAQPSNIDSKGSNLVAWLNAAGIAFIAAAEGAGASVATIAKDAYTEALKTDPWLEAFAEGGVLSVVDALPGNGTSDSTSSNSSSGGTQDQTGAGSDAGAGGTGDVGNGGTAPDANGNSDSATGSGAQSDVSGGGAPGDSSQSGSGSSSDVSPSSNTPSTGGDAPAPAPSPAPVVTPEPVAPTAPVTEVSSAIAWLEDFAKTASVDAHAIINTILNYVREMTPGKSQTPEAMQRQQVNLHSALMGTVNRLEGQEFKQVYGGILRLVHEHRDGVFHDRYVYRQLQNAPLNSTQRAFFERTMNMIKLTADPQGRKAGLKQFDKTRTMQHGLTEAGRNKLLSFYGL